MVRKYFGIELSRYCGVVSVSALTRKQIPYYLDMLSDSFEDDTARRYGCKRITLAIDWRKTDYEDIVKFVGSLLASVGSNDDPIAICGLLRNAMSYRCYNSNYERIA